MPGHPCAGPQAKPGLCRDPGTEKPALGEGQEDQLPGGELRAEKPLVYASREAFLPLIRVLTSQGNPGNVIGI